MEILKIVDSILDYLGLSTTDTLSKNSGILCRDAICALVLCDSIKDAASMLEVTDNTLEQILRRHFKPYCNKDNKTKWGIFLLSLIEHRKCIECKEILPYLKFSAKQETYTTKNCICKDCDIAKNAKYTKLNKPAALLRSKEHYVLNKSDYLARNASRRALKLQATPPWANLTKIREIYRGCPELYHVDHIVPLQGDLVCGLHVENNLQYLTIKDNLKKSNKFTVD